MTSLIAESSEQIFNIDANLETGHFRSNLGIGGARRSYKIFCNQTQNDPKHKTDLFSFPLLIVYFLPSIFSTQHS